MSKRNSRKARPGSPLPRYAPAQGAWWLMTVLSFLLQVCFLFQGLCYQNLLRIASYTEVHQSSICPPIFGNISRKISRQCGEQARKIKKKNKRNHGTVRLKYQRKSIIQLLDCTSASGILWFLAILVEAISRREVVDLVATGGLFLTLLGRQIFDG